MKKILIALTALFLACSVHAQIVPSSFNYQGILKAGDGGNLVAGHTNIAFRIYDAPTSGNQLWGRSCVAVLDSNGLFNVELSDENGSLSDQNVTNSLIEAISSSAELFLGLTPEGGGEILPRQQLLSVPYAMMAGNVKEASGDFAVIGSLTVEEGIDAKTDIVKAGGMELTQNSSTIAVTVNNGNLAVNSALKTTGDITTSGNLTASGKITADGDLKTGGTLTVDDDAHLNGATTFKEKAEFNDGFTVGTQNPMYMRRFSKSYSDSDHEFTITTDVSTDTYTACVVGFKMGYGDIDEDDKHDLPRVLMAKDSGKWVIHFTNIVLHKDSSGTVYVDVLFIRREICSDSRF